jgi:hypothetical protein
MVADGANLSERARFNNPRDSPKTRTQAEVASL